MPRPTNHRDGQEYATRPEGEGRGQEPVAREVAPRYTYRDYLKLAGDERYEVIEGALVLVPSPSVIHQDVVARIWQILHVHAAERGLGKAFLAPLDVVLSDTNVLQPDVIFVAKERSHIIKENCIAGAPDLVVEVLSKSTVERDKATKRGLYQRFGVKECWIVDPYGQSLEVFSAGHQVYTRGSSPSHISPLLPELVVDLASLFD